MCGIAGGFSSSLNGSEIEKIRGLMLMSCFRGMYGSGSIVVTPGPKKGLKVLMHKTELCAAELALESEFCNAIKGSPKIIVSHARAPTRGDNSLEFVHPHRVGHITGVHNGTMHRVMDKVIDQKESDSLACYKAIAEHGVEAFIKESRGAYSLVWVDTKEGSLNFLRNDQRPMVLAGIGWGTNLQTIYFSSEHGQLSYVLNRHNQKLEDVKFVSPKPWQHVKYPLDVKHSINPLEIKQYEDPIKYTPTQTGWMNNGWSDANWAEYEESVRLDEVRKAADPLPSNRSVVHLPRPTSAYRGTTSNLVRDPRTLPTVDVLLKGRNASNAHFPSTDAARQKDHLFLIRNGKCVVCDGQPEIETGQPVPEVYPIKVSGISQYICDDCVTSANPIALSVLGATATRH